jgi:hypothetical protein
MVARVKPVNIPVLHLQLWIVNSPADPFSESDSGEAASLLVARLLPCCPATTRLSSAPIAGGVTAPY